VTSVCSLGPDSGLIASASVDKTLRLWRIADGECVRTLVGHEKWVTSVCSLGPDSGLIASASLDNTLRLWRIADGECVQTLVGHESVVTSVCSLGPDAGLIASASWDMTLRLWRIADGECVRTLVGHESKVTSVCSLGPDSGLIASGSWDTTVRIWEASSGKCLKTLRESTRCIAHSLCSLPGGRLATCCFETAHIWDVSRGECLETLHSPGVLTDLCLLGRDLIAGGSLDGICIWDVSTAFAEGLKQLYRQRNIPGNVMNKIAGFAGAKLHNHYFGGSTSESGEVNPAYEDPLTPEQRAPEIARHEAAERAEMARHGVAGWKESSVRTGLNRMSAAGPAAKPRGGGFFGFLGGRGYSEVDNNKLSNNNVGGVIDGALAAGGAGGPSSSGGGAGVKKVSSLNELDRKRKRKSRRANRRNGTRRRRN
jgi:hypothetical protein